MKNYILYLLVALLGGSYPGNAQNLRKVTLKKGSWYEGTIQSQDLVNGNMSFLSKRASKRYVSDMNDSEEKFFLEDSIKTVSISYDDIEEISAVPEKQALSGLEREYTLNGMLQRGIYLREKPGAFVYLLNDNNETIEVNLAEVTKFRIKGCNPNQDIFDQADVLDSVVLLDGMSTKPGLIIERNYESEDPNSTFIVLLFKDHTTQTILFKNISMFVAVPNKDYKPLKMNILQRGQMMINDELIESYSSYNVDKKKHYIISEKGKGHRADLVVKTDSCEIIFETNEPESFSNKDDVRLIDLKFNKSPRGYYYDTSQFEARKHCLDFKKDQRSGTVQYIFKFPIKKLNRKSKEQVGFHPDYMYGLYLEKKKSIIPVLVIVE